MASIACQWCYKIFAFFEWLEADEALVRNHIVFEYFLAEGNARHRFDQVMLRKLLLSLSISCLEYFIDIKRNESHNRQIGAKDEAIKE